MHIVVAANSVISITNSFRKMSKVCNVIMVGFWFVSPNFEVIFLVV